MTALPTTTYRAPSTHSPRHLCFTLPISQFRRARARLLLALLVLLSLYTLSPRRTFPVPWLSRPRLPPTPPLLPLPPFPLDKGMAAIAEWESALPQSEVSPIDAQGGERYLRFLNERLGIGFNNQLQEM
jgi:hypothetical protein